jgi:Glyoxalase/Bleomycin resistance protein/Dioxygenase superfamily
MSNEIVTAVAGYHQVAYITNDFDQALQVLGAAHGIDKFLEMRDLDFSTGADRVATCHIALANVGNFEYELIAPLRGDVNTYNDELPTGKGFALRFHHLARRYPSLEALDATRQRWRAAGRRLPINGGATGGTQYFYGDFRAELGHYIECIYFPPEVAAYMKQQIPNYGARYG